MNISRKNQKGFILMWALAVVVLISFAATSLINQQRDSNITFWKKSLLLEEAIYSHMLTLEGWAKSRILKGKYDYLNLGANMIESQLTTPKINIVGEIEAQDGKFNLALLDGMTRDQERVISYFFKKAFPGAKLDISLIVSNIRSKKITEAKKMYGRYEEFVYYNPKPDNIGQDERSIFPDVYQININAMNMYVKNLLLKDDPGAHPGEVDLLMGKVFKSKSEIEEDFGQLLTPLLKTKSLFYNLNGNIIVDGYKRDFLIKLEGNRDGVSAVSRRIL